MLPKLEELMEDNATTKRRKEIFERFQFTKGNLEWILFLLSLVCKMVYRSEEKKEQHEIVFLEVVTMCIYLKILQSCLKEEQVVREGSIFFQCWNEFLKTNQTELNEMRC